jgi:glycosyltransferase involved in cell wall biosynthesis
MKILYCGFASLNHSWSICAQNLCRSFIKLGHQVDIFSTNGIEYFPEDLKPNLIGHYLTNPLRLVGKDPSNDYDMQLSYTAMKNFPRYLSHGSKNRFGIYCYEFAGKNSLPPGFAKQHIFCDKLLAPSTFAKQVFLDSGVPAEKITVIPHGINLQEFDAAQPFPLKTKKSVKILMNLGQIHRRKDLPLSLEIFGKSFTKQDDICLVLKIQDRQPSQSFELSFNQIYQEFNEKYPNHAEVEIIRSFIPNIYSLYKSCQIMFSTSNTEGFGMPQLESLALGLINVSSRYGGVLDFLDDNNSLLIEGSEFNVPGNYLYYQNRPGTKAFKCSVEDGCAKLKKAVEQIDWFQKNLVPISKKIRNDFNWLEIGKKILTLTN